MKKTLCFVALGVFAALPAAAQALKPGLWEMQHKMGNNPEMDRAMAQARQQMEAMPPEQRKQMEAMMASRGVAMAPGGGIRMCMTKEMAERSEVPPAQGNCRITDKSRSGNTMKSSFTCSNPASSGTSEFTFASPEAYSMKTVVNTTVNGKAETHTIEGSGKWLSADCGSVKPPAMPAQK